MQKARKRETFLFKKTQQHLHVDFVDANILQLKIYDICNVSERTVLRGRVESESTVEEQSRQIAPDFPQKRHPPRLLTVSAK